MGALYAVNTVCSVAASLATGFLLIPWFGLQRTLACASGALVVAVALLAAFGPRTRGSLAVAVMAVALVFAVAMERPWDRDLLASGAYKYAPLVAKNLDVETALKAGTLLYYRDGASATVSVRRLTGELSLSVDGKVDASSTVDMLTQKALAHLPLLLHRDPHDVAVIGLGSGVTLGSALKHPVSSVDVVEIAPEVVDASRFFDAENGRALADPRARLIIGDGRSHLQLGARSYDVIISEPSNPWMAGIAALFTREFLAAARSRLRPGGVMCQWAHTYNMSDRDMRSIVATFASVFPNGTLWLIGDGDLLMVGSASPDPLPLANLPGAWTRPGVADDLAAVGASEPFALLSLYVGGAGEMRRYAADARVQTDDRMALEFSAPAALYRSEGDALVAVLRALLDPSQAPPPVAQAWASADGGMRRRRGDMLLKANAYAAAYGDYIAALDHNPEDLAAARGFVRAAVAARMTSSALAYLDRLGSAHHGSAALTIARSKLLAATGDYTHAVDAVRNVAADGRTDVDVAGQLASLYADLGDTEGLRTAVGHLRQVAPDGRDAHYYTAALQFMQADLAGAVESARRTVAIDPQYAPARNLLGAILATMGRTTEARSEFQSALALDPRDPAIYTNLGRLEFSLGDRHTAAGLYAEALSLDPTWEAARQGLSQAAGP
jgi:spermidine synthase